LRGPKSTRTIAQWAKPPKKQPVRVYFLTIWHCNLSAEINKNTLLQILYSNLSKKN